MSVITMSWKFLKAWSKFWLPPVLVFAAVPISLWALDFWPPESPVMCPGKGNYKWVGELMSPARENRVAEVERLIVQGADVNQRFSNLRTTPLMGASAKGHVEVVRILLDNGADIDAQDTWGETALVHAASQGRTAVVKLLLEAGANANARDKEG